MTAEKKRDLIQDPYANEVKESMRKFYNALPEKERRLYAAIESIKFGYGGKKYICDILGCTEKTLNRGLEELQKDSELPPGKQRHEGGGKKKDN